MDKTNKNNDRVLLNVFSNAMIINSFIHDFKHKLNYLNMTAIQLQREYNSNLNDKVKLNQRFDSLISNIEDMNHSFDNFSQLNRPRKNARSVQINLENVVRDSVGLFSRYLKDRNISLRIDSEMKGLFIKTDPNVLKQVIVNIIENSINSFELVSRKPEIGIQITSKNQIIIIDNGVGIDATLKDKIFEPGFTTSPNKAGFGLYIAKSLIEDLLKGKLIIESIHGTETKVIIQLNSY